MNVVLHMLYLQVFQMAYCESADLEEVDSMCQELLKHVKALDTSFLKIKTQVSPLIAPV